MADFGGIPTANYTPPDGLATLGSLMSLKQKQQSLQAQKLQMAGQESENQSLAAKAQGDQQDMQERQAFSQIMKSGKDDQGNPIWKSDSDGHKSPDLSVIIPALGRVAPKNAQALSQSLIKTESDKVGLQGSALNLDSANRQNLQGIVQSGVANSSKDVNASLDQYIQQHPEAAPTASFIKNLTPHLDTATDPKVRQSMVQSLASRLQPGSPVATQATPMSVHNGAQTLIGTAAPPVSGGAFTPASSVAQQLTPGERLPQAQPTTAGIVNRDPRSGALSAPAQNGPAGQNLNPSQAQATAATGMAGNDTTRYSQISQEGTNANTGAQLADQVSHLAEEVRTGKLSKEWADRLAVLKQHDPDVTARQMLSKYAAQLKTMATSGATTDASRSQIDEGMPSPETMDPDAVKQASQYVGGIFRMRGARQEHADRYVKNSGGSPMGMQGADDAFMRSADPTIFAYNSLKPGAERQEFLKNHGLTTPDKLQEFKARMNQVNHYSGGQ